jgi:hypothetical protein
MKTFLFSALTGTTICASSLTIMMIDNTLADVLMLVIFFASAILAVASVYGLEQEMK